MNWIARIYSFHCILLLAACSSVPLASSTVIKIDQPRYLADLKRRRHDLLEKQCKANLIAKPEFRDLILGGYSMSSLIKDRYSNQMQTEDIRWADEHRQRVKGQVNNSIGYRVASYYDPEYYVGYLVGVDKAKQGKNLLTHPFIDKRGIGFKAFFQLRNFQSDLGADDFQSFAQLLVKLGFHGDLKVQLHPGNARFKFNNIVVHCATKQDCFIVEKAGLKFFAGKLIAISRGADVDIDPNGNHEALDWSEFLCNRKFGDLPADVQDYVNYK